MSTKRKSAFSVYKRQRKIDENMSEIENVLLNSEHESIKVVADEIDDVPLSPARGKKAKMLDTSTKEKKKNRNKQFSRVSKIRRSIGIITSSKKGENKKNKLSKSDEICETDSDSQAKKNELDMSPGIIKATELPSSGFVHNVTSSGDVADLPRKTFEWLINPVTTEKFFGGLWENKPLLLKRHVNNYYDGIFNAGDLDRILRQNDVRFSVNLDVTSYKDGQRETHNPPGRALPPVVWDFYQNGCSVRMLNPQTFSDSVWKLNATLQEYFGSFVGSNIYLTPPNSQGFAPHYDDIEAFVLQLEGKKHWRLYSPRFDKEVLPRLSSDNFSDDDIGDPILDVVLEPGDLLYFPRGTIHQADTLDGPYSLHITLSTYQKTSWGDFMEELLPKALHIAIQEDVEFRHGLPLNYLHSMGVTNSETSSKKRSEFLRQVEKLLQKLVSYLPVDEAVDQMGIKHIHDSLPPVLSNEEKDCSIFNVGAHWQDGQVTNAVELNENTEVRLVRKDAVRLVWDVASDGVNLYYSLENSRVYHEQDSQYMELTSDAAPFIENIMETFPNYITVKDLPGDLDYKIDLLTLLYEKGILITKKPLTPSN